MGEDEGTRRARTQSSRPAIAIPAAMAISAALLPPLGWGSESERATRPAPVSSSAPVARASERPGPVSSP